MRNQSKKKFTYDHVLNENTTQQQLFDSGPKYIVEKSLQGYNGCILVYGQTSSGKTYSMYGENDNVKQQGIVYKATEYIIQRMKDNKDSKEYKLSATFLEIYNEQLKDLLKNSNAEDTETKIKIREDKKQGIFVDGISTHEINLKSAQNDLKKLIDLGNECRTVAATEMNAVSSRSHSVLGLHIYQKDKQDKKGYSERKSTLYLVDLAGSERAGAQAHNRQNNAESKQRLKEGNNINLSLSMLGMVIKALVENNRFIPYRNSQLTRLLQECLGGNSVTNLIANLTPAKSNCADSLSTLQFANRAKNIKNKASKYTDAKQARIAQLEYEIEQLKRQLQQCKCKRDGDTEQCKCIVM